MSQGEGAYNKGLTENGCRIRELTVKQMLGLDLVNGGFKFKQTGGAVWVNEHPLCGRLTGYKTFPL